ncbi:hypothetical protein [Streptomyces sp. NPDC057694]|uniref:hypothetical protein n=1 Tax=Streptomyces sp. NPDC057694 TaxID=3346216 RepID=UPI0036CBF9BE
METLVLAGEMGAPVGVEVAVGDNGTQPQDSFAPVKAQRAPAMSSRSPINI